MVFCFQNCSDLPVATERKNCSSDRKKLKVENLQKDLRSLKQFIQTVNIQINF